MSWDLELVETGNGGDLQLLNNDLSVVTGIENFPYLGMYGGNVAQTSSETAEPGSNLDWWGNTLLMPAQQDIQFNSIVEKTLNNTELTLSGRVIIENAIKTDLVFMSPLSEIQVTVIIVATDRINVLLKVSTEIEKEQDILIGFTKSTTGDWVITDFNDDFLF